MKKAMRSRNLLEDPDTVGRVRAINLRAPIIVSSANSEQQSHGFLVGKIQLSFHIDVSFEWTTIVPG